MTMIESVAVRQRGAYDFEKHYDNLCALQSSCPLPAVKVHLEDSVLDLNGDRIRAVDWIPILNTIRINKTLNYIALRSYFQQTLEDQEKAGYPIKKKTPAIRCKEITYRLCRGLKECLAVTPALACLELQGLPLRERDLTALSKGVAKNSTLQHLSLEYSRIGDDGLEIVCRGVKNSASVTSVNFTGCSLTWRGAEHLAKVIKHQATKRHNEAWQDSLRYRRPDLDRMPGVRRITINCNPMLGDGGAGALAEALKDDLWLKALDLQQCGISEEGAKALLDVLKYNTTIVVLDVRQNPMIEQEMLHNMMEQVMINCNGQDTEYKWVKAEPLQDPLKPKSRKKRTRTLQSSFGKKTTIKVGNRKRSRSAGATVTRALQPFNAEDVKPGPGMPWRTALRANRYRGYPPEHSPGKVYENVDDISASPMSSPGGAHVKIEYSTADEETTDTLHAYRGSKHLDSEDDLTVDRELKVELEQMRRRYREEKSARAVAEEKVLEMSVENSRLRQEVDEFRVRRSILDDDRVLESIEASFKQFHAFLDLVRDAGLGQLITLAGIDQSQMTIPLTSPQRQSLGGRLSMGSSFIRPRKADSSQDNISHLTANKSFLPIRNGDIQVSHPTVEEEAEEEELVQRRSHGDGANQSVNTTVNTTGMTSGGEGDVSLPPPASKILYPHITPDNFQGNADPTMHSLGFTPISLSKKPVSKFDELYQKVLKETEGVISKTNAGDSLDSSGMSRSGLNYSSFNGSGDNERLDITDPRFRDIRDRSKHHDQSGVLSDTSHHSQGSQRSQRSHRSQGSKGSQRSVSHDTVVPRQRQESPDHSLEQIGLDPGNMIIEHHSESPNNRSEISDVEEIHEDLDVPDNSPAKGFCSDNEDF